MNTNLFHHFPFLKYYSYYNWGGYLRQEWLVEDRNVVKLSCIERLRYSHIIIYIFTFFWNYFFMSIHNLFGSWKSLWFYSSTGTADIMQQFNSLIRSGTHGHIISSPWPPCILLWSHVIPHGPYCPHGHLWTFLLAWPVATYRPQGQRKFFYFLRTTWFDWIFPVRFIII